MDMYTLKDCLRMSVNLYDLNLKYKKTYESLNQNIESLFSKSDFILGHKVIELEKKISNFSKSKYVSCVGNGTDALIFSLKYLKRKFPNKKCNYDSFIILSINFFNLFKWFKTNLL